MLKKFFCIRIITITIALVIGCDWSGSQEQKIQLEKIVLGSERGIQ